MPLLRAAELRKYIEMAKIDFALCDSRLSEEMRACEEEFPKLMVKEFDGTSNHNAELEQ